MTARMMSRIGPLLRPFGFDLLLAALLSSALVVAQQTGVLRTDPAETMATALFVVGGLALRRVAPVAAMGIVAVAIVATEAWLLPVDVAAMALASYSLGESPLPRWRALAALSVVAATLGLWFLAHGSSASAIGLSYLTTLPAWAVGAWTNERRTEARQRSESDRAAQDGRIRQAIRDERRRLASELHDIVAHDVGIMVVQAGGARQMLIAAPERTREALLAIEATGRDALVELRQILGLLVEPDDVALDTLGAPDLERVARLVRRVRETGLEVAFKVEGEDRPIPEPVWAVAYRIVQEGLTNAMKHGAGAPIGVSIAFQASALVVEVVDEGHTTAEPAADGRGLAGLRERSAACGGTLEAGPREGGGFALRASLPLLSLSET